MRAAHGRGQSEGEDGVVERGGGRWVRRDGTVDGARGFFLARRRLFGRGDVRTRTISPSRSFLAAEIVKIYCEDAPQQLPMHRYE